MISRCSLDVNSSNYVQVFCNIILLVIFILVLYYYIFYICKVKKEKFETKSAGCITMEQNDMDVEMRQCSVYFVDKDKEDDCDRFLKYYNMTDIQLDIEISNAKNTNKHDFVRKLEEIKQHNSSNGNKCKLTYDNWKEIQKYHDKSNGEIYTYSKKNATNAQDQVNYKLWNSCFSSSENLNDIGFNEGVVPACTTKISNVRDINSNDNNYLSIMFNKDATFNDIYQSICQSKTDNKALNIPIDKIFMKIECEYNSGRYLKIKNLEFVKYNNNSYKFDTIDNDMRITDNINSLFHIVYDKISKRLVVSPKTMNKGSYLIHYNVCKNIEDSSYQNLLFSFKDFEIENKHINTDLTKVPKLIENLDKIQDEHDIFQISNTISSLMSYYEGIKNGIKNDISKINQDIDLMLNENIQKNQSDNEFQEYIDKIFESRKTTDEQLYKYLDKINMVRNYISRESLKNSLDEGVVTLNNSQSRQLASETNQIIMTEYNTTVKNLNIILEIISNKIKTSFSKGSYVNLSTYKANILPSQIQSLEYITNLIQNTKPINSVSSKLDHGTISRINTSIDQSANINCFAIELSTNILLNKGYYNFSLDVESDDATCVYLGYKDSKNKEKMIFRNVAYYLSSTSRNSSSIEYPIESVLSNNSDVFTLSGTSKRSNNYWNMFDNNKSTFWSSDNTTYSNGKGVVENKTNYKGEVIYIDIKNPSRLLDYSIKYKTYDNAPNKFRIYGTNDNKGLNNINHSSWKLVDDIDNASYISGKFEKHVYKIDENHIENKIVDDTTNMLAWYKFDRDTLDSSGKGNHLKLKNNPKDRHDSVTSKNGSSINFDGDTYLENNQSGEYFNPNNITISVWIHGGKISSGHQAIASARSYHGAGGWMIYILPHTKKISVWYGSSNRWVPITTPDIDVLFKNWTLITVTIDNNQNCSIYVNGQLIKSDRFTGNVRRVGNSLRIGGGANESSTPRYYLANGAKLEDFRIYNKILSKYEIETIYNNSSNVSKIRKYPPAALAPYENQTDSTKSVTLSGQQYGNGKYELSWSSDYGSWKPPHWFDGKHPSREGGHFAFTYNRSTGTTGSNRFLKESNYMGDWVKIKMPTRIFLSYIKIYQRNRFETRAPIDYKVYGTNNGETWTEIIHTLNAKYENKVHTSQNSDLNFNTNSGNFVNSTTDMVAWYKFENNWKDSSGKNNNLEGKSGVVDIIGDRVVGDYSANFNGHFRMENKSINLSNKSFSVCYWANRRTGGYSVVLGQGSVSSRRQALHLGWRGNKIMFGFYSDDCDSIKTDWNDLNEWHHYCFTYDHSSRIRRIYYDGKEISTSGQKPKGDNNFNNVFTVGRAGWNWRHNNFNGKLDDLRIYQNKVLSADEINAIFQNTPKTNYVNESFNEFAIAVKRIGTGNQSYVVNYDEIEFYGTEEKQEDIVEKYRYYAMVTNELKGNQTSCQINEIKLYFEAKNGLTTKFPIYIDGNYNNGYYALYVTSLRNSTNKSRNYFNVKYTKQDSAEKSISLFDNKSFIYKFSDVLKNSQTLHSINDLLYVYNDLKQTNVYPNRQYIQNGNTTYVDPGVRKINDMFYISCPSLPSLPDLPSKEMFRLKFQNHNVPKNKKDIVKNLQNVYDVQRILIELSKLRNIQFDDFDCMFKVDVNNNITSATNTEIYNKKLLISSKTNELDLNNKIINDLIKINQQVSEYVIQYDINSIISVFQKQIVFNENSELFYKYIRSVFKNTKDNKYYMYIQLN